MASQFSFGQRLLLVAKPTGAQVATSIIFSALILFLLNIGTFLRALGISNVVVWSAEARFHDWLGPIAHSSVANYAALFAFWALVGLFAYLVCWGMYNVIAEAKNQVVLNAEYANRGHWRGAYETLGLKAACAVLLVVVISLLLYSLVLWPSLIGQAMLSPTPLPACWALVSIMGFALQLYLTLVCVQLTFTPWYRPEAFTEG